MTRHPHQRQDIPWPSPQLAALPHRTTSAPRLVHAHCCIRFLSSLVLTGSYTNSFLKKTWRASAARPGPSHRPPRRVVRFRVERNGGRFYFSHVVLISQPGARIRNPGLQNKVKQTKPGNNVTEAPLTSFCFSCMEAYHAFSLDTLSPFDGRVLFVI
jgi:hypothetical protein